MNKATLEVAFFKFKKYLQRGNLIFFVDNYADDSVDKIDIIK